MDRNATRSPPGALRQLPPQIALVDLDDDLAHYLREWFALHWPQARVRRAAAGADVVADLAIIDREPIQLPQVPTLWLAEIDRSAAVIRLGPRYWRTAMPTTALRLMRVIEACLDRLPP
jgi:hypothetical protein